MGSNGYRPKLRVAPERPRRRPARAGARLRAGNLDARGSAKRDGSSPTDVALHVVESSSDPNVAEEVRRLREVADAPLILAAYGEPNGIVETGLAVGAVDVLVLPQPTETLLFALRKAARSPPAATETGKVVTVFSPKGGSGKTVLATNLAVAAARSGHENAPRRPRPAVRRLGADARDDPAGDDRRPRRLERRHRRREAEGVRQHRRQDGCRRAARAAAARRRPTWSARPSSPPSSTRHGTRTTRS